MAQICNLNLTFRAEVDVLWLDLPVYQVPSMHGFDAKCHTVNCILAELQAVVRMVLPYQLGQGPPGDILQYHDVSLLELENFAKSDDVGGGDFLERHYFVGEYLLRAAIALL